MSTRSITLDLPVSIMREITAVAQKTNKSIEQIAIETITNQFPIAFLGLLRYS